MSRTAGGFVNRRDVLASGAGCAAALLPATWVRSQNAASIAFEPQTHGLSIFGDLKYPADFKHFAYVNPDAPKGGEIALQITAAGGNQNFSTFNTLNIYSQKGDGAAGMGLIFDSLMAGAADEPDSLYGLVAKSVQKSRDGLVYRFEMRPEAHFHDGSPLTAEDVAFSFDLLKGPKAHPSYRLLMQRIISVTALAPHLVEIRFPAGRSREMPLAAAGLPIFSKAYYSARDFEAATLESPLGSGGYRVDRVDQGRSISFRRVPDYWGRDLPVSRGQGNFDVIRYEYFRDREAAFQAFTAGEFTFREELTSLIWSTRYDFPAAKDGRVKRDESSDGRPSGTQGWWINTRKPQFRDARIREAIALAFDFEWVNKNLMYDLYKRTNSYFENSPLKAEGKPTPAELALLESFRGKVPDEVFGEPYTAPVSDGSGQDRNILRRASQLLQAAGAKRGSDNLMRTADGALISIEFLENDPGLSRHTEAILKNLRLLGLQATIRQLDPAQFAQRVREFDYDLISARFSMSLTPGESIKLLFGSEAAGTKGSRNLSGIADPAIDAMIEKVIAADTREEITTATRALDRLLRAGRYWIGAWHSAMHRYAYWDMFGRPGPFPPLAGSASASAAATWWLDAEKAKRIGR